MAWSLLPSQQFHISCHTLRISSLAHGRKSVTDILTWYIGSDRAAFATLSALSRFRGSPRDRTQTICQPLCNTAVNKSKNCGLVHISIFNSVFRRPRLCSVIHSSTNWRKLRSGGLRGLRLETSCQVMLNSKTEDLSHHNNPWMCPIRVQPWRASSRRNRNWGHILTIQSNQFHAVLEAACAVENENVWLILREVVNIVATGCQI